MYTAEKTEHTRLHRSRISSRMHLQDGGVRAYQICTETAYPVTTYPGHYSFAHLGFSERLEETTRRGIGSLSFCLPSASSPSSLWCVLLRVPFLFLLLLLHSLLHTILFFSVCISVAFFLFCALLSISSSVCLSLSFCFFFFLSIFFCDFWKQWARELWGCVHFHGAKGGLWIINRERMEDGGNHVQCGFRLRTGQWKPSYLPWPWPTSIVFFYDWVSTQYYALLPLWSFWKGIPWHHCFQLCLLQITD